MRGRLSAAVAVLALLVAACSSSGQAGHTAPARRHSGPVIPNYTHVDPHAKFFNAVQGVFGPEWFTPGWRTQFLALGRNLCMCMDLRAGQSEPSLAAQITNPPHMPLRAAVTVVTASAQYLCPPVVR